MGYTEQDRLQAEQQRFVQQLQPSSRYPASTIMMKVLWDFLGSTKMAASTGVADSPFLRKLVHVHKRYLPECERLDLRSAGGAPQQTAGDLLAKIISWALNAGTSVADRDLRLHWSLSLRPEAVPLALNEAKTKGIT